MSEPTYNTDDAPDALGAAALAQKIHKRLSGADFSAHKHDSAVRAMGALYDALDSGAVVSRGAQLQLLCAGVALQRRIFVCEDAPQVALLGRSAALLLVLIVLADRLATGRTPDADAARDVLQRAAARSVHDDLRELREDEPDEAVPPGELAKAAMQLAGTQLETSSTEQLIPLAATFFKASGDSFVAQQLSGGRVDDFLTLGAARFAAAASRSNSDEAIQNVVSAAESEMGQVVFRDLIMSFKLPAFVLGVRRVLIVTREAQQTATESFPEIVNEAHNRAMEGALWSWKHNDDAIVRICVLLAGSALLLTEGGKDEIRKADAFAGRVLLPFLETPPAPPHLSRITLVPQTQTWTLHKFQHAGKLSVECSGCGEQGLLLCLLPLLDTLVSKP